jgi:hypothetical protein
MSDNLWSIEADDDSVNEELAAELVADLQEAWQDKAVKEFPNVAPLRAHLRGNSKQEILDQAKAMSESLKSANPGPAVTGGSPALGGRHPGDTYYGIEQAQDDIRRGVDRSVVFEKHLRQKYADAGIPYPSD